MNEKKKAVQKLFISLNDYFFHDGSFSDGEISELMANAKIENDTKDALIAKQEKALRVLAETLVSCGYGVDSEPDKVGRLIAYAMSEAEK